jgi:hypothetical protein
MSFLSALKRDDFSSSRHPTLVSWWSMNFSENRYPLFGIMLENRFLLRPVSSELALQLSSDAGVGILTGISVADIGGGRCSRRVRPDGTGRPENFRPRRATGFTHRLIRLGAGFAGDGRSGTERSDDDGGDDDQP